jgi:hypothetical protein
MISSLISDLRSLSFGRTAIKIMRYNSRKLIYINKRVVLIQPVTCCIALSIPVFMSNSIVFLHLKLNYYYGNSY